MIVTVTPNPSLDLTYLLDAADSLTAPDVEVHRARSVTLEASGKGVNVSRVLVGAGFASLAVFPAGGATGRQLAELLDLDRVGQRRVQTRAATRLNTTVLQPGGVTTKINGPGEPLAEHELAWLVEATAKALDDAQAAPTSGVWLAVCGSLPPGPPGVVGGVVGGLVGDALVGALVRLAHERGVRCVVDTSGPPLAAALAAGADLLAPNAAELAELSPAVQSAVQAAQRAGDPVDNAAIGAAACAFAAEHGVELLVSLGAAGAIWTDGRQLLHSPVEPVVPLNTAGAGDALLAGWLAGSSARSSAGSSVGSQEPAVRLARAVSWGRAACLSATTVAGVPPESANPSS